MTLPETGGMALHVTNVNVKLASLDTPRGEIVPFEMQRRHGEPDTTGYPTFGEEI